MASNSRGTIAATKITCTITATTSSNTQTTADTALVVPSYGAEKSCVIGPLQISVHRFASRFYHPPRSTPACRQPPAPVAEKSFGPECRLGRWRRGFHLRYWHRRRHSHRWPGCSHTTRIRWDDRKRSSASRPHSACNFRYSCFGSSTPHSYWRLSG